VEYWGFVILAVAVVVVGGMVALGRLLRGIERNDDTTHGGGTSSATW
jgi:hypothetical protein